MFSTSGDKMVWGHVVLPLQTAAGASSMHFMVFTSLHIGGSAAAATTSDSSKQQIGIIIGIVVAALAAICVIVMLWRHWRRRPRLTNNQLFHLQTTAPAPAPLTEDAVKALQPITWTEEPVYPADEYQSIRETTSLANEFIGAPHQRRASSLTFDDIPATASEASFVAVTTPVNTSQRTQGSVHVPPARPLRNQVRFANIPSRSSASSHASEEVPPAPLSPQESVASVGTTMTSDFAMSQQPQQLPAPHTGSYRVVGDTPCFTNAAQPALWSVEEGNEEGASPRSDGMSTLAAPSIFSDDDDGAGNSMRTIQFPISQPPAERASSQQAPSRPSNNLEFDPNTTVTL